MASRRIAEGVKLKTVEDKTLLFIPEKGEFYKVNPVGGTILGAIKKGWPDEKIVAAICETFDVDSKTAKKDLDEFIGELRKKDALA
jgi:hypothetical protein